MSASQTLKTDITALQSLIDAYGKVETHLFEELSTVLDGIDQRQNSFIEKHRSDVSDLLEIFDSSAPTKNILKIVERERVKKLEDAKEILSLFDEKEIYTLALQFNPLDILLGFDKGRPNEDDHTNLLMHILSSKKASKNNSCIKIFIQVLKEIYQRENALESFYEELVNNKGILVKSNPRVRGKKSVIDLLIKAGNYALFIENKCTAGSETYNSKNEAQTVREKEDSDILTPHIPENNRIFVFINPSGKRAECSDFLLLDRHNMWQFFDIIAQEEDTSVSLRNFIKLYSDFYMKYV